jgi:undecaprenyl-diphosphatase
LGIVEGLTEFLPISSTGHLILVSSLLDFHNERGKVFEVVIQTGAIAAIAWVYRERLWAKVTGLIPHKMLTAQHQQRESMRFWLNLLIAFLPLAVLGLLFGKMLKAALFNAEVVATAFIVGGVIILWVERRIKLQAKLQQQSAASPAMVHATSHPIQRVEDMQWHDALKLGCAQAFALIPGTSRSGATIIGGLLFGFPRQVATEFSFFLALPTLTAAGLYDLYKHRDILVMSDVPLFIVGLLAAFFSALWAVKGFIRYVSTHDFTPFAWYRIVFGVVVLLSAYTGAVKWVA